MTNNGFSQSDMNFSREGKMFLYWGYNFSAYTNSDIHFWGNGYSFTITDIKAGDEQTTSIHTYIQPKTITVPQYNLRIGYFLDNNWFISLGWDHMKYVMSEQSTHLTGTIASGNDKAGSYINKEVLVGEFSDETESAPKNINVLQRGFVPQYEQCDGLSDLSFEFGKYKQLWISRNGGKAFSVFGTLGTGIEITDTECNVLGAYDAHHSAKAHSNGSHPEEDALQGKKGWHPTGYGLSTSVGVQFDFSKNFFFQTRLKGGFIDLWFVHTTHEGGRASQHFGFVEPMFVIGYSCKAHKN